MASLLYCGRPFRALAADATLACWFARLPGFIFSFAVLCSPAIRSPFHRRRRFSLFSLYPVTRIGFTHSLLARARVRARGKTPKPVRTKRCSTLAREQHTTGGTTLPVSRIIVTGERAHGLPPASTCVAVLRLAARSHTRRQSLRGFGLPLHHLVEQPAAHDGLAGRGSSRCNGHGAVPPRRFLALCVRLQVDLAVARLAERLRVGIAVVVRVTVDVMHLLRRVRASRFLADRMASPVRPRPFAPVVALVEVVARACGAALALAVSASPPLHFVSASGRRADGGRFHRYSLATDGSQSPHTPTIRSRPTTTGSIHTPELCECVTVPMKPIH